MLVDHTAVVLVLSHVSSLAAMFDISRADWVTVYGWMRQIGRIAFPLFCFTMAEGFIHTHNRPRYALRLTVFAIVSEIPFDLALNNGLSKGINYLSDTNVMFTLLIAFLSMWGADAVCSKILGERQAGMGGLSSLEAMASSPASPVKRQLVEILVGVPFILVGAVLAEYLDVDYHAFGVLLVGGLWLARRSRLAQVAIGLLLTCWYCLSHGSWLEMWNIPSFVCILFYSGERGRGLKYFFYVFYPGHLLLLWLLGLAIF